MEVLEQYKCLKAYHAILHKIAFPYYELGKCRGLQKGFSQGFHWEIIEAEAQASELIFPTRQRYDSD